MEQTRCGLFTALARHLLTWFGNTGRHGLDVLRVARRARISDGTLFARTSANQQPFGGKNCSGAELKWNEIEEMQSLTGMRTVAEGPSQLVQSQDELEALLAEKRRQTQQWGKPGSKELD